MGFIRRSLLDDHSEDDDDHKSVGNTLSHNKWIMVAVFLSIFFLVFVYYATIGMISKRRRSATSRQTRDLQEELNQNPNQVDHPIWYIRTVGLEESIIDSITVCRYIKGEGLIEDTECSVCLSEFEDDESLKLLPKCSHAFHISCIDTWLRSHVNCPLCRAPIISNSTSTLVDSNASNPSGEYQMENNTTNTDPTRETQPDERTEYSDDEEEDASMNSMKKTCCNPENHREGNSLIENEDGIRPMRRSASLASSYDRSIMHNSEDIHLQMDERSLISMNPESIEAFDSELTESYGERRLIRECNGNKNVFDLMNLSSQISMGQKQPFIMQRSLSSGAKFFLSHYRRNRSSILPL